MVNFENDKLIQKLHDDGLVETSLKPEVYIDVAFLIEGRRRLLEHYPDKKIYALSEGMGFFRISKEARTLSASAEYSSHLAAVAVVTTNISISLLADLYLKIDKPVVPTRVFASRVKALEWLRLRMKTDRSQQSLSEFPDE